MRSTQRSRGSSTHYLSTTEMDDGAKRSLHIDQTSDLSNEEGWQEYLQTREVQVSTNFYTVSFVSIEL